MRIRVKSYKSDRIDVLKNVLNDKRALAADLRAKSDYKTAHIAKTVNIPFETLRQDIGKFAPDLKTPLYVFCYKGNKAKKACSLLGNLGYSDVTCLGGIVDWPYDLVYG